MKDKWQQLNKREQLLVTGMSVFVMFFLLYSLVWQPINEGIAKTEKKLASQQELLTWVQEKTTLLKHSGKSAQVKNSSGSLSSVVNSTARSQNIVITRIQPKGEDIQVWIDQAVFDTLLQWLGQLVITEGVQVKAIDLSNTEQAGVVKVRSLQLGRN